MGAYKRVALVAQMSAYVLQFRPHDSGLTWSTIICSHCGRTIIAFIISHKTGLMES